MGTGTAADVCRNTKGICSYFISNLKLSCFLRSCKIWGWIKDLVLNEEQSRIQTQPKMSESATLAKNDLVNGNLNKLLKEKSSCYAFN